jgi:hypothetical protein
MIDTDCRHARVQCFVTGVRSFITEPEPDGVILITQLDLDSFHAVQVDVVCLQCGDERSLEDNEWEVA